MYYHTLIVVACAVMATSAWSPPFYPVQSVPAPLRVIRYAPHPPLRPIPVPIHEKKLERLRPKRNHDNYEDHHEKGTSGVIGPVHTFVKTDKNANYKWGVRHHVGNKYA